MDGNIEYDLNFWNEIEKEVNASIPEVIKIFFSKCGFDCRMSLLNIKIEDVQKVEQFISENYKELLKNCLKKQPIYNEMKYNRGQAFEFLPGHRNCIITVSEILASVHKTASIICQKSGKSMDLLPSELANEMKSSLCNSIVKWAKRKKLNASVNK